MKRVLSRFAPFLIALTLGLVLLSCGSSLQPSRRVLVDALSLQVKMNENSFKGVFDEEATSSPEIVSAIFLESEVVQPDDGKIVKIMGRFDWRYAGDTTRKNNYFEVFLEQGNRKQSWRLAKPLESQDGESNDWMTFPLPIHG